MREYSGGIEKTYLNKTFIYGNNVNFRALIKVIAVMPAR
jgi:hypothetical protein